MMTFSIKWGVLWLSTTWRCSWDISSGNFYWEKTSLNPIQTILRVWQGQIACHIGKMLINGHYRSNGHFLSLPVGNLKNFVCKSPPPPHGYMQKLNSGYTFKNNVYPVLKTFFDLQIEVSPGVDCEKVGQENLLF